MIHYLIDAYNVIGVLNDISLSDKNKEERFIEKITRFLEFNKKSKATLIFDGKRPLERFQTKYSINQTGVIFSACDESADDVIIDYIEKHYLDLHLVTVSSDRKIRNICEKNKVKCMLSKEFVLLCSKLGKTNESKELSSFLKKKDIDFWLEMFS